MAAPILRRSFEGEPIAAEVATLRNKSLIAAIAANRFGLGARAGDLSKIEVNPDGWLKAQFNPDYSSIIEDEGLPSVEEGLSFYLLPTGERKKKRKSIRRENSKVYRREVGTRARFAVTTEAPFRERLVRFWSNHFTVSQGKRIGQAIGAIEREAIRPHVGGRFIDMLIAVESHPVMLIYLDNVSSTGPGSRLGRRRNRGFNENFAREILELHTLGVRGGYTQKDVISLAQVLTGWTVGKGGNRSGGAGAFHFEPSMHQPGPQMILGKEYRQIDVAQGYAVFEDLARHPSTAHHVAQKLAVHFISDAPPRRAVDCLRRKFLESDGSLSELAKALVDAPEASGDVLTKLKTPEDFILSTLRVLGSRNISDDAVLDAYARMAQRPFHAPSPAGWPDTAADWLGPDALRKRLEWANLVSRQATGMIDPMRVAGDALGPLLSDQTRAVMARAKTPSKALTLLLMSPEFQRR